MTVLTVLTPGRWKPRAKPEDQNLEDRNRGCKGLGEWHVKEVLLAPGQRRSMRGQCGKGKCHDESDESPLPAEIMSKSKLMTDNTTLTNLNQFMTCELKIQKKRSQIYTFL